MKSTPKSSPKIPTQTRAGMQRISVFLPPPMKLRMKALSNRLVISESEIIRSAIESYLKVSGA